MIFSLWAQPAAAQTYQCSDAVYFSSSSSTNVYRYTPSTTAITQLSGVSTGGSSAGAALTPTGSRLYTVDNNISVAVYNLRYNTGSTTNTTAGSAILAGAAQRNAIAPNGTGYFMVGTASVAGQYYTYTTGGTSSIISGPNTLTVEPASAPAIINGGDIAFDASGIAYLLDQGKNFYRLDFTNNVATFLGTFTGMGTDNPNGLGFTTTDISNQNFLYASTLNNTLYRLNIATMTATLVTPSSTASGFTQNDIASCIYPAGVTPSIAATKAWRNVTKGDPADFSVSTPATGGDTIEYRIIVRNSGVLSAGSVTLVDPIPASLNYVANSTTLNTAAVTDSGGSGNTSFPYRTAKNINGLRRLPGRAF